MKILMLPSYFGGVSWWRFEVPARFLREAGHEVYCPNSDQLSHDIKKYNDHIPTWINTEMPKYDLIHMGYNPDPQYVITIFKARDTHGIPVITDIDDNLDHVPTYNKGWNTFRAGSIWQRTAKTQASYSDGITFSTPPLADSLGYLAKNCPSAVLENWIDVDSWDHPTPPERTLDKSVRLMVTGGGGRFGDWAILKDPLEWAMAKFDGKEGRPLLRLFFLGATPDWVLPWMRDRVDPLNNRCFYIQPSGAAPGGSVPLFNRLVRYVSPDIIVSPTQKNEFNRSKSGLKFLESALTGAAFICTDYDTYAIAPSDCAIKVDNSFTQWQWALEEAITKPALRAQMVEKARAYTVDFCDAKDHITPRLSFYESVLEGKPCQQSQVPQPEVAPTPSSLHGKTL